MTETEAGFNNESPLARLRTVTLLDRFDDEELRAIFGMSRTVQHDKNDFIIRENDYDNRIYSLLTGEARIEKEGGQRVKILWKTDSVFGEMGVIEGVARSATVVAQKNRSAWPLTHPMSSASRSNGDNALQRIFMGMPADRLRTTTEELAHANKKVLSPEQGKNLSRL